MSFQPADFPGFGGLNLAADSEDSPGALDLSNVTLSQPGPSRLLPRPGYTLAGTLDLSAVTGWSPVGSSYLMGGATNLQLVAAAGTQTATGTFTTGDPWTVVPFGGFATPPTVSNGGFETNTTGWTATTSTITRDTGTKRTGAASGRWDNTGASDGLGGGDLLTGAVFSGTFYAGIPYTVAVWIRAGASCLISLAFGTSVDYESSSSLDASTSFDLYYVKWTPDATVDASTVSLRLTPQASNYYYIDDVSLTQLGLAYGVNGAAFARLADTATVDAPYAATRAASATTFTQPINEAPKPLTIAVQPKDNRMVAWGFAAANYGPNQQTASGSHAYFSQAGDPEAWDETDFVILAPGDGETGRAAVTYNDFLLLFKQTKFFVFYGNSTDSTGGAVFNYRTVDNAFGGSSSAIYQGQVCSAPSGVYVITDTGVWKTTGGPPQLVSTALTPLFRQNVSTLAYAGTGYTKIAPRSATGSGGAFWHQGRVFFSVTLTRSTATTSSGWLILDEQSGQWTVWEFADTPRIGASVSGAAVFPSGIATSGRKGLLSMDGTATTDNGTAIASYYTAPYLAYGEAKAEKHVRATELHGTGTVTLAWGKDLQTHGTAETVAMSSGVGHARTGARGRVLSFKIAASAAGWTVNRVVPMLQSVRTGR